jgi:hypothetical protein
LPATGAWTTWQQATVTVNLQAGSNEFVLEALTNGGLANIDLISFSAGVSERQCVITSVSSLKNSQLVVYPNPTQGKCLGI